MSKPMLSTICKQCVPNTSTQLFLVCQYIEYLLIIAFQYSPVVLGGYYLRLAVRADSVFLNLLSRSSISVSSGIRLIYLVID